ncbi:MAG: GHKL domain-containing protein, partial [Proteobacteria bacterium]|nr:GHKL domain-containing protein [Pseudomonadota bacterium]
PEWNQKINIAMRLDPDIYVMMDPAHLNQILWNLLKNAAQAIEDSGEIKIQLKLLKTNRVYLTVEDTGAGINIEAFNHVFDPFFTTKPEGTGLGLPIIHRLIDTYSGLIDFESIPGRGTRFTIFLNGVTPGMD